MSDIDNAIIPIVQTVPSFDKLADALAKAQSKIIPPKKNMKVDFLDKNGRRVKYNYADLAGCIASVKEPLAENGLAVSHIMSRDARGFGLTTILFHVSGQSIDSWYPLPDPEKDEIKPQEFGGCLTYARRYSLSSIIGIASEEDVDGDVDGADRKPTGKVDANGNKNSKGPQPAKSNQAGPKVSAAAGKQESKPAAPPTDVKTEPAEKKGIVKKDDPDNYVMPFGEPHVKGKTLNQLNEKTLKAALKWCGEQMKITPPVKNLGDIMLCSRQIKAFLASVDVEVTA